jgi:hypothetical protein
MRAAAAEDAVHGAPTPTPEMTASGAAVELAAF